MKLHTRIGVALLPLCNTSTDTYVSTLLGVFSVTVSSDVQSSTCHECLVRDVMNLYVLQSNEFHRLYYAIGSSNMLESFLFQCNTRRVRTITTISHQFGRWVCKQLVTLKMILTECMLCQHMKLSTKRKQEAVCHDCLALHRKWLAIRAYLFYTSKRASAELCVFPSVH